MYMYVYIYIYIYIYIPDYHGDEARAGADAIAQSPVVDLFHTSVLSC